MTQELSVCDACVAAFEEVIIALGDLECEAMGEAFEAACGIAAALLPPPFDVAAELGCAGAAALIVAICVKYGATWIHEHPHDVAQQVCKSMHIC